MCGGDVVRIYHFELSSFLVGKPNDVLIRNEDNPVDRIITNIIDNGMLVSFRKTKAVLESK